ncbi:MAG TPA: hypothetical protein VFD37_07605, partial [Solirubrobacterales bacterium]|nr:hypothetical protein [Solirubrobacterales bacterium]
RGLTNPQIVDEITYSNELIAERQERLGELEVPEEAAEQWQAFLDAGARYIEINDEVLAAARADETQAVNAAFAKFEDPSLRREQIAEELGMEVCGVPPTGEVELTGTGPDPDIELPEVEDEVDEVATELAAAIVDEDCEALGALAHPQLGWFDQGICSGLFADYAGIEVLGSEEYGPAAVAEVESELGEYSTLYFVLGDEGEYRYLGLLINDGRGLRPANEDADHESVAQTFIDVLAAGGNVEELLADPENDPTPVELRQAVRGDDPAEGDDAAGTTVSTLGVNQAASFHLVDAGDERFVLVLAHMPGGESEYRVTDVVALPPAEAEGDA